MREFAYLSSKLGRCPICRAPTRIEEGPEDYSIICSDGCTAPRCEHHDPGTSVLAWMDWARWYKKNCLPAPYAFEEHLAQNEMSMNTVNARRFGAAVRQAMRPLEEAAGCYKLYNEPYYRDTLAFLERMAARLEAEPKQKED